MLLCKTTFIKQGKIMNKSTLITALFGAILIVGCGGGSNTTTETSSTPNNPTASTETTNNTCQASGNTVLVPEGTKCTYSIANLNGGAVETYSCTNNRVSFGGLSASQLNLNGTIITCS